MISVPQLFKNKLEDVTNLSHTILLPIAVQMYEFQRKSEKLKKKSFESPQTRKLLKRLCRKICREIIITHTAMEHSEPSQTSYANIY